MRCKPWQQAPKLLRACRNLTFFRRDTFAERDLRDGRTMTSLASAAPAPAERPAQSDSRVLSVQETMWGYILGEEAGRFDQDRLLELGCRFLGLILILCAYGQWFLPGSVFVGDVLAMKAALSFFFGASGAAIYWFASRGLMLEVHVDLSRRELRVVNRNSRDQVRLHSRVPMRNVESAFMRRDNGRGARTHLMLRLRDKSQVMHVASGSEAEMHHLHRRLSADIKPAKERLEDRLARQATFMTSRLAS